MSNHIFNPHLLEQVDHQRFLRVDSDRLEIYLALEYLQPAECQALIQIGEGRLRRSTVTVPVDDPDYRTSQTCDIGLIDDPFVGELQKRIANTLGIELSHAEVMQLQRYEPGEQFKGHTDYFEPGSQEYAENALQSGNLPGIFLFTKCMTCSCTGGLPTVARGLAVCALANFFKKSCANL